MAQVGGVRIPFLVDTTDIPRSVKEVESQLRHLRKVAESVDIRVDGKRLAKLNAESIIPLIRNFKTLQESAKRATIAIKEIGGATNALRAGKVLSDRLVNSLSQISGVGAKTVIALKEYNKLTKQLHTIEKAATSASRKMAILGKHTATLRARRPLSGMQERQLGQFASQKAIAAVEEYRQAELLLAQGLQKRGSQEIKIGKNREKVLKRINKLRLAAIAELEKESRLQRKTLASQTDQQLAVNKQRERAISLLKKAQGVNRRTLEQTKQRLLLEASPRVGYAKRLELEHARNLDRVYRELMVKRKKGIITDHERIRLARTMEKLMKRQGWSSKNRLRLQERITLETKKQVVEEKKRSKFPGGGLLAPGRMMWFVQLRAFWAAYQVVQKAMMDLVELDEGVGRAMRTMRSETKSYGEVAEKVHETIIEVGKKTGAMYRDIGEALYQLSSAGLSAEEALSAVNSVMRLTRTTEAQVTDATKVVAGVFNNFRDSLGDVVDDTEAFALISGTLSYVWKRNQVDMNEMVQALNQSAQVAKLANLEFKDLAVILGNLGTMMIRSGRAGRSIRMAIIQMAAKGQELADTFRYTFDPNAPLDFVKIMDKMHKEWVKMNKTALITYKITNIFGRRAAPTILAALDNWGKIKKEMEGAGDVLELITQQQLTLLRLQERYKQITETVWKEIMANVEEYANVLAGIRDMLHSLLVYTRRRRAEEVTEGGIDEILAKYKDAGAITEELGRAIALLTIAQEKEQAILAKGVPLWKKAAFWMKSLNLETSKRDKAEVSGVEKEIEAYENYIKVLEKALKLQKERQTIKRKKETEVAMLTYDDAEATAALNFEIEKHRSLRGEQVYSAEELVERLGEEKDALDFARENWKKTWHFHKKNLATIKETTAAMFKQSDTVKKLAANLLKLYKIEQKATKQHQKDQLSFYDARIKIQEVYSKGVEKWTGVSENREMQAIDNKIERLATERSHIEQNMIKNREAAEVFAAHADETGKLPAEMVGPYQTLNIEYEEMARKVKLVTAAVKELVTESMFVGRMEGVGVRFTRTLDIVTEEEWEAKQHPQILAEQQSRRDEEAQHELELFDIRTAYKEKYANYYSIWYSEEEMAEKARLARQRERLTEERRILEERRIHIQAMLATNLRQQQESSDSAEQQRLAGEQTGMEAELENINRALGINAEHVKAVQQTKLEAANANIRALMREGDAVAATSLMWKTHKDNLMNYTGQMVDAWKNMFEQMGQESKTAWDVYKALAISQTIVAGIQLAWEGAKALAGIPYVGPALALAWIGTIAAQTAVQVKMIEQQKPAGYAEGGIATGDKKGYPVTLHGSEAIIPLADGKTIPVVVKKVGDEIQAQVTLSRGRSIPVDIQTEDRIHKPHETPSVKSERRPKQSYAEGGVTSGRVLDIIKQNEETRTTTKSISDTSEAYTTINNRVQQNEEVNNRVYNTRTQNKEVKNQIYNKIGESEIVNTRVYNSLQQNTDEQYNRSIDLLNENEETKTNLKAVTDEQYNNILETLQQQEENKNYIQFTTYAEGGVTPGKVVQIRKDKTEEALQEQQQGIIRRTLKIYDIIREAKEATAKTRTESYAVGGVTGGKIIEMYQDKTEDTSHAQRGIIYNTLKIYDKLRETKEAKTRTESYAEGGVTSGKEKEDVIQIIRDQAEDSAIAQKGIVYADLVTLDKQKAKSASYASGGVTRGPTLALVGDNKSGREIIIPEENIKEDSVGPAYRRDKEKERQINVINLVTQSDVAAAMSTKLGGQVIVNQIGKDMVSRKSTYRRVKETNRRR